MNVPLTPVRFLRYAQDQYPHNTAVVCGEQRFTYQQFGARVSRLAGALREYVAPGDRVAFLSSNCHRLLEAYYGVLEAKAVLLPLNIRLAAHELAYVMNDSGATVLFLEPRFASVVKSFIGQAPALRHCFLLDGEPRENWLSARVYEDLLAAGQPCCPDLLGFDENAVAELFYTSGTSARPKGVMLTHRNIYLHALDVALALGVSAKTAHLHTIPLFHANGWGSAHMLTLVGGKHVMIGSFDPTEVLRLIARERIETCFLVPTMAAALVQSPERHECELSSLQWIAIGGSAASPTLMQEVRSKLGCECFSAYGLTEASPVLAIARDRPGVQWKAGTNGNDREAMTGYAIPGVELRVVDLNNSDVPHDGQTIGELITRSDGVMGGYWGQETETAEALDGGWLRTGDMATIDSNGYTLVIDRKKDIIISGGENISSLDLEKVLLAHPSVSDAAVIAVPDSKWGEVPKAFVVLKAGHEAAPPELIEFCRSHAAHFKTPRSVDVVPELPKNALGKTLKRELRNRHGGSGEQVRQAAAAPA